MTDNFKNPELAWSARFASACLHFGFTACRVQVLGPDEVLINRLVITSAWFQVEAGKFGVPMADIVKLARAWEACK